MASIAELYIGYRDVQRKLYRSQEQAFRAAVNGEAVAALILLPLAAWQARGRSDLRVIPVSEKDLQFAIGAGVRRRDPGLAAAVDGAVERLLTCGEARAVLTRYGASPVVARDRIAPSARTNPPDDSVVL